ncbi:hypothetical protein T8J41_19575 (plasmid) [Nitratireductor rhodophyticola]|jgi:hypothetical protein|nr:hypothetical protein [Nitratireductor rhodophyticola]MEC9246134.1 hypothetical protein [Pseudomonadota bacterium]WPZ16396.1 hypothetical protein T8J41_19575 [Nitratireductor rhodophyticola]
MMMECMGIEGAGWIMAGVGLFWILLLALIVLAMVALVKYVRS